MAQHRKLCVIVWGLQLYNSRTAQQPVVTGCATRIDVGHGLVYGYVLLI